MPISYGGGTSSAADADIAAHVAASDPHAQYQKESEKGAANGYMGLDVDSKASIANIPVEEIDHSQLKPENLEWEQSGHYSDTVSTLAAFGDDGQPEELTYAEVLDRIGALPEAGGTVAGNLVVTGNFAVYGSSSIIDSEHIDLNANYIYQNTDYTTVGAVTAGIVANYLPTAVASNVAVAGFVAGVASTSNPEVTVASTTGFTAADIIQVSGSTSNDGFYEVLTVVSGTVLRIAGIGLTSTQEAWSLNQFTTEAGTGVITKINVTVNRCGTDGVWESAKGSTVPLTYVDFATLTATQTLQNKTLDNTTTFTVLDTNLTVQDNSDITKQAKFELSGITTGTTRTLTLPNGNTTLVGTGLTQTLQNKTIDNTNTISVKDASFTLQDDSDTTKQVKFELSPVTTATIRILSVPNATTTIVGTDVVQTLANKTIDNTNTVTVKDTNLTIQDDADTSKQARFQASGITASTTRTFTLPNDNLTLVGGTAAQPVGTTDNALVRSDGTSGTNIQGANTTLDDNGVMTYPGTGGPKLTAPSGYSTSSGLITMAPDITKHYSMAIGDGTNYKNSLLYQLSAWSAVAATTTVALATYTPATANTIIFIIAEFIQKQDSSVNQSIQRRVASFDYSGGVLTRQANASGFTGGTVGPVFDVNVSGANIVFNCTAGASNIKSMVMYHLYEQAYP